MLRLDRERAGRVENPRRSVATTAVLRLATTSALSPVFIYYISGFGMIPNPCAAPIRFHVRLAICHTKMPREPPMTRFSRHFLFVGLRAARLD